MTAPDPLSSEPSQPSQPSSRHAVTDVLDSLVTDLEPRRAVSGAQVLGRGRRRARVRRVGALGAAGLLVAGVAVVGSAVLPRMGSRDAAAPEPPGPTSAPAHAAPEGWTTYASDGLEVDVPSTWAVNPLCPQGSSITRGDLGAFPRPKCAAPEDPEMQTAVVMNVAADDQGRPQDSIAGSWAQLTWTQVPDAELTSAEVPAALRTSPNDDGRTVWMATFPDLGRGIAVTSPDPALVKRILASVRVVRDRDAAGCPLDSPGMPDVLAAGKPAANGITVPDDVTSVSACYYGHGDDGSAKVRALASGLLSETQKTALLDALRQAPAGLNPPPDLSAVSCVIGAADMGLQLRLRRDGAPEQTIWISYGLCSGVYGMSDGTGTSRVTLAVLDAALDPLHVYRDVSFLYGPDGELIDKS